MAFNLFGFKLISFILILIFISLTLLFLNQKCQPKQHQNNTHHLHKYSLAMQNSKWIDFLKKEMPEKEIKIGLVNMDVGLGQNEELHKLGKTVNIRFNRIDKDLQWSDFFLASFNEDQKENQQTCPKIPMPDFEKYIGVNVVVARVPCENVTKRKGIKDLFRLQVNLVVANLLVRNGSNINHDFRLDRTVYAVFIGSCGPMLEIFRCDDLLMHEDGVFVYRPNMRKLKQKVLMPVGTCQVAPPHEEPGDERWRVSEISKTTNSSNLFKPRHAYVTLLHSAEAYVCGAIALAQSLIQTSTTKDLILLVDDSLTKNSIQGLKSAGWKVKRIERIKNPNAQRNVYSEWNYSKLRIWQLYEYDKIIYIDADLIVLKNMDKFFVYPQLSAVPDINSVFNSGVMLVEPSKCTFETLMEKMFEVDSYDEADQGFLNEIFTWWHRWPSKVNRLKIFDKVEDEKHEIPEDSYAIHYMGLKPWMCAKKINDCNWDVPGLQRFASDSAHRKWLWVYEALPDRLQHYCDVTVHEDPTLRRIMRWKESYKNGGWFYAHGKSICFLIVVSLFISFSVLKRQRLKSGCLCLLTLARHYYDKRKKLEGRTE